jgi:hypothetical protein
LLTLSYSSENWTTNAQDKTRIWAAEMKVMGTAKYSWMNYNRCTLWSTLIFQRCSSHIIMGGNVSRLLRW